MMGLGMGTSIGMQGLMVNTLCGKISTDRMTALENDRQFMMYYNQLLSYALTLFEYDGLPKELEKRQRWIELCFMMGDMGAFYYDDNFGKYNFLLAVPNGGIDMYGDYLKFQARGMNGYYVQLNPEDCVIGYNNYTRCPNIGTIVYSFAKRMGDIQRTLDVRLNHHKAPIIYTGNHKTVLSIRNIWKKVNENEPYTIVNDSLGDITGIQTIVDDIPLIQSELFSYKKDLWNEAMLFLGIDNAKQDKKERMVTGEVEANNEQVDLSRNIMLKSRQDFCKEVNERFGLNISVKFTELRREVADDVYNPDKEDTMFNGGE